MNISTFLNPFKFFPTILAGMYGQDGIVSKSVRNLLNSQTGNALTDAQHEQYELSEQAADNAAVRAEDLFNKTQSLSAQADQAQRAGFNPFSVVSSGVSPGSVPSGPMASAPGAFQPIAPAMLRSLADASLVPSEIRKNEASTSELLFRVERGQVLFPQEFDKLYYEVQGEAAKVQLCTQQAANILKENEWFDRIHQAKLDLQISAKALNEAETEQSREQSAKAHAEAQRTVALTQLEAAKLIAETQNYNLSSQMIQVNMQSVAVKTAIDTLQLNRDISETEFVVKLYESGYMQNLKDAELAQLSSEIKLNNAKRVERYAAAVEHGAGTIGKVAGGLGSLATGGSSLLRLAGKKVIDRVFKR